MRSCDLADLLIAGASVRAIEPPGRIGWEDAKRVDASDRLRVPGLINAHTHDHGGLGKGAVAPRSCQCPFGQLLRGTAALGGR